MTDFVVVRLVHVVGSGEDGVLSSARAIVFSGYCLCMTVRSYGSYDASRGMRSMRYNFFDKLLASPT